MRVLALIKFGAQKHMESFVQKGEMRLSPLEYYHTSLGIERGDALEGAVSIINEEFEKIEFDHPTIGTGTIKTVPGTLGRIVHFDGRPVGCFSSYALTDRLIGDKDSFFIDNRMETFGDYAVVIPSHYLEEYFSRVQSALKGLNIKYSYGHVTYQNLSEHGEMKTSVFTKDLKYSHQSEHRIIALLERPEPLYLNIGSIEDITMIASSRSWVGTEFKVTKRESYSD